MSSILREILNGNYQAVIIIVIARAIVVFLCLPIHELCHAFAATKLGDDTARLKGRLTFNPLAHLDPVGTIMIFLFGIGYAKPVPINPVKFKNYRRDIALTALAGPLSNLAMAFVAAFVSSAVNRFAGGTVAGTVITLLFMLMADINISLAVFNLLPIPPLDGSRVLAMALPDKAYERYFRYERIIMIVLIVLLFTGILDGPLSFLTTVFQNFIFYIPNLIFG